MVRSIVAKHGWLFVGAAAVIGTTYASWLYAPQYQCGREVTACVAPDDTPQASDDVRVEIPTRGLPHKGARAEATHVTMIECSDFQCPFSRRAAGTVDELIAKNDDVAFFHAHFPLAPMHEHAMLMARASVAAQRQGAFWPMHDALFARRVESEGAAIDLAARLGLDSARFAADLHEPTVHGEVERQRRLCRDAGVRGVPTFFINGRRMIGSQPVEEFQRVIDEERDLTRS